MFSIIQKEEGLTVSHSSISDESAEGERRFINAL